MKILGRLIGVMALALAVIAPAAAHTPVAAPRVGALVDKLRQGGLVIVFRHAERQAPDEDELSEDARRQAVGLGQMLRDLRVAVGETYTGTRRTAVQAAELARFDKVTSLRVLDDSHGHLPPPEAEVREAALRALLRLRSGPDANLLVVSDCLGWPSAPATCLAKPQESELLLLRAASSSDGQAVEVEGRLSLRELRDFWLESGYQYPSGKKPAW